MTQQKRKIWQSTLEDRILETNYNYTDFAIKVGVTRATLNRWLKMKCIISNYNILKVHEILLTIK
jgi:transcriptional regulator with XRE-family HTH domain|tara:strand:+ start:452 stop:646 length:195 start_codon:yes stop_codon:yes gene_type:complete